MLTAAVTLVTSTMSSSFASRPSIRRHARVSTLLMPVSLLVFQELEHGLQYQSPKAPEEALWNDKPGLEHPRVLFELQVAPPVLGRDVLLYS